MTLDAVAAVLQRIHARTERAVMETRLSVLVVAAVAAAVVLQGACYVPLVDVHLAIAADPTAAWHELGRRGYLLDSPVLLLIAHALGVTSRLALCALSLSLITVGLGWLVWLARRSYGDIAARLVAIAFFVGPLSAVLVTWLGQPDPLTMTAAGTLVLARSPIITALAAILLGFNHFEAGVPIVLACTTLLFLDRRDLFGSAAAVLGLLCGKLLLTWWHVEHAQEPMSRLDYLFALGWKRYVIAALGNLPVLVFSSFSLAWPLMVVGIAEQWSKRRAIAVGMVGSAFLAAAVTLLALDSTRIFALVSWPLLIFTVTRMPHQQLTVWCLLAGIIVPRVIVWDGGVFASGFHRLLIGVFEGG